MEILEKGYKNRRSCKWCGSILAYSPSDVKYRANYPPSRESVGLLKNLNPQTISLPKGTTILFFVECPNCGFEIKSVDLAQSAKDFAKSTISTS